MKRDDFNDYETRVKIHEGTWRFRKRRGTVAATVPVSCQAAGATPASPEEAPPEARARGPPRCRSP